MRDTHQPDGGPPEEERGRTRPPRGRTAVDVAVPLVVAVLLVLALRPWSWW